MTAREIKERANGGVCATCGGPRPPGRVRYCGDECNRKARAVRQRAAGDKRVQPCKRCGGAKEPGIRGGRFCAECRRVSADAYTQYELERRRRRGVDKTAQKLENGERVKKRTLDIPDGHKWCARCQEIRPLTSFPARKSDRKAAAYCIPCQRAYNQERRLQTVFGMTIEQYDSLYEAQGGRCAICLRRPRHRRLAVDHDHQTEEIRGLLCSRCNKEVLGSANESSALLRRAANYLERPPARTGEPLEALEHFEQQTDSWWSEVENELFPGEVSVDPTGQFVVLSLSTATALAQAAGFAIVVDGERYVPASAQLAIDDMRLVRSAWESFQRLGGDDVLGGAA